jgi:hypothetical protein
VLALGTSEGTVIRWSPAGGDRSEEVDISRREEGMSIRQVFVDPSGSHILVCLQSGETYHLHCRSSKPRRLVRWSGVVVDCVAFDRARSGEMSAKGVLVGSSDGRIFEASLESSGKDKLFSQVAVLAGGAPASCLKYESSGERAIVLAASCKPTRLYCFTGSSASPEALFRDHQDSGLASFQELPGTVLRTELHLHWSNVGVGEAAASASASNASPPSRQQCFAMLTSLGIYHGDLHLGAQAGAGDGKLLPFQGSSGGSSHPGASVPLPPRSMAVTDYHFLLLYPERLVAVSRLSGRLAAEMEIDAQWGHVLGLVVDPTDSSRGGGRIWLFTDRFPVQVLISRESRFVWRIFLEKAAAGDVKHFDTALLHCPSPRERGLVNHVHAGWLLDRGEGELAAALYAKAPAPFEEVALKLLRVSPDEAALRCYVRERLALAPPEQKMQRTMLCTWLVELYLRALAKSESAGGDLEKMRSEFRACLRSHARDLNPSTTVGLLTAHGRFEELLFYAEVTGDFEKVVAHRVAHGPDYAGALTVLRKAPFEKAEALIYRYSAVLVDADPEGTTQMWMEKPQLRPTKLIPALVRYGRHAPDKRKWAISYLEHCVTELQNREAAIHNHLLTLYAEQAKESDVESEASDSALLRFLNTPPQRRFFDLKYALRVCSQLGLRRACVRIYSAMGLHEEAVELALQVDPALARADASGPEDPEVRKRLWLQIARHEVQNARGASGPPSEALSILRECDLLKIEDVLPFFPDFSVIDAFRSEICASLEEHNRRIEKLREEMAEYTESAEAVQAEMVAVRSRTLRMSSSQRCEACLAPAVARPFYLFPCGHALHCDCQEAAVRPHLSPSQIVAVDALLLPSGGSSEKDDALRAAELDGYIAAECMLCGEIMIESVDQPLPALQGEAKRWDLPAPARLESAG